MSGGARNWACLSWIALATALAWPSCVPGARAEIVRIEVLERADEPAGEGVGAYARWRGRLHGELDPAAAEVASIQDIGLAPRSYSDSILLPAEATRRVEIPAPGTGT